VIEKKYQVAIVGSGRVAQHYLKLKELGLTDFLEYKYCFDFDTRKMYEFSKRYGIKSCSSLDELLNQEFDFAIVSTPSGTHYDIASSVLKANKNVLIEKPACLRIEEIKHLEEIADSRNLVCKSIFQNRFNRAVLEAQKMMKEGLVGEVTSFSLRLIWSRDQKYYEDEWHGTWLLDGGVTSQQAIHHIDCVNNLIGVPSKVHAYAQNSINILEAEDTLVSIVEIEPKILGTFHFTTAARPSDMEASLLINGTKASIRISGVALNILETFNAMDQNWEVKVFEEVESGYGYGHARTFREFLDSHESTIFPTMKDSFNAVMVVDSLYESLEVSNEVFVSREVSKSKLGAILK
jgi:UDP-N-acetyl-2-amino-2-deoxyglucuronate dehydrogenase